MREVGERHRRGAVHAGFVARRPQHFDDRVDDEPVLASVLLRPGELVGARAGTRHRARGHVRAAPPDQELGARADESAVGVHDAAGLRRPQRCEHRTRIERAARLDQHLARQHDLLDRARVDQREDGGDLGFPLVETGQLGDAEDGGRVVVGRGDRLGRGRRRFDERAPHAAIGRSLHERRRDDQTPTAGERECADRSRPDAGRRIVEQLDRTQRVDGTVRIHPRRRAGGDEPGRSVQPRATVGAEMVEKVGGVGEGLAARAKRPGRDRRLSPVHAASTADPRSPVRRVPDSPGRRICAWLLVTRVLR